MSLLGLLAVAVGATAACSADKAGYCTDKVVKHAISYAEEAQRLKINTALGDVVSVEFPKGITLKGEPAVGNRAIFDFRAQTEPFRILVWPKLPQGASGATPADLMGQRSNLQVFLDSGVTVLLELKIAQAEHAVQRVVFEFPQREKESEWVTEQLSSQARKLREEFEKERQAIESTVADRARHLLAGAILKRVQCADLSERGMQDLFVVWARRICRIGDLIFIEVELKNRARDIFHLGEVEVTSEGDEEGSTAFELTREWDGETSLAFDKAVRCVLAFDAGGDGAAAYQVRVRESGGKKRVVTVDDVEF